jgi:hypothetical protein
MLPTVQKSPNFELKNEVRIGKSNDFPHMYTYRVDGES